MPDPTYEQLLTSHAGLLAERSGWVQEISDMSAEINLAALVVEAVRKLKEADPLGTSMVVAPNVGDAIIKLLAELETYDFARRYFQPQQCAKCGQKEPIAYAICQHVAEGGGIYVRTSVPVPPAPMQKRCHDRACAPLADICGNCWDNLHDGKPAAPWWPAKPAEAQQ